MWEPSKAICQQEAFPTAFSLTQKYSYTSTGVLLNVGFAPIPSTALSAMGSFSFMSTNAFQSALDFSNFTNPQVTSTTTRASPAFNNALLVFIALYTH